MKSVHSDAPPASRPVPEVCGKVLGNGHAVGEGSGSAGAGVDAAAGTSVGIPAGIWAAGRPPLPATAQRRDDQHVEQRVATWLPGPVSPHSLGQYTKRWCFELWEGYERSFSGSQPRQTQP